MRTQPLMLDVDTGVDDAAAMAFAVGLGVNLVGVSSVAGNVPIDLSTDNTLRVLSYLRQHDVPVFRGASRPLVATYQDAAHIHGANGLGDAHLSPSPMRDNRMTGPEAIISMADQFDDELTLVMLGPLTDLAIALSLRPRITDQIARLVIMGGAFSYPGNITPHAEFNIYVDPHAASQVFSAQWRDITAVGLDVSHLTALTESMWEAIPDGGNTGASLIRSISERTFNERTRPGFLLHDPLALGVALDPSLISGERCAVQVSTDGNTRGQTTVSNGGNVLVASDVQAEKFVRWFCEALGVPFRRDTEGITSAG